MKKLTHISLALILLMSTVGFTMSKHFCGDILEKVSVNAAPKHCCDDEKMPDGCCHDESQYVVLDQGFHVDHQVLKLAFTPQLFLLNFAFLSCQPVRDEASWFVLNVKSPPRSGPDIFIQVQSFLI